MRLSTLALGLALFIPAVLAADAATPRVYSFRGDALARAKERLAAHDHQLAPALDRLRAEANALLALAPLSVTDKTKLPASGDWHDYYSFGPYWWPNPAKPDGLPYIRRDGDRNPESRRGTDSVALATVCHAVETLGLAYYFTGYTPYAEKAAQLTRVWFLNPATRMNPNLQHAQAIPGLSDGRGIGLIESRHLVGFTDGLALIADSPAWLPTDRQAMTAWLERFYDWLIHSQNGRDEAAEHNNHGSWYDVQAAHLALVLGRESDARRIVLAGLTTRLEQHIEPDGRQPHELARTRPFNYSLFNLEALFRVARLGEHVGVDWWNYTSSDGRSLLVALRYLAPHADPAKPWPDPELPPPGDPARLLPLFAEFLLHRDAPQFHDLLHQFARPDQRWRLLYTPPAR